MLLFALFFNASFRSGRSLPLRAQACSLNDRTDDQAFPISCVARLGLTADPAAGSGPGPRTKHTGGQPGRRQPQRCRMALGPQGERPLNSGDEVAASERVLTGKAASVSLVLRDGSTLMLGPDSAVDLKEFRFNPTTNDGSLVLSVVKGTLRMITGLIGKTRPESVRITTPTSTIGVLGTDFIVEVSEEVQP